MTLAGTGIGRPNPDSGGKGGGGGGSTGGGSNTPPINPALVPSSGGLSGFTGIVTIPGVDLNGNMSLLYFDTSTFDTENVSLVQFRVEDSDGAQVTIKRVRIKYRNFGVCKASLYVRGMFSTSPTVSVTLGSLSPTSGNRRGVQAIGDGKIYNAYYDLVFTDENPQLVITRNPGDGQLSIVSIVVFGDAHKPQEQ